MEGIYINSGNRITFVNFLSPDFTNYIDSLPPSATSISASSDGLVLLRNDTAPNVYILFNPTTRSRCSVVSPPRAFAPRFHEHHHALVFTQRTFHIVTVPDFPDNPGDFFFFTFSLSDCAWRRSRRFFLHHARIVPDSGVSCDGVAYWRTKEPWPKILAYDLVEDRAWFLDPPEARRSELEKGRPWTLGRTWSTALVCVIVMVGRIEWYIMERPNEEWSFNGFAWVCQFGS